jgi:hypothetical protein
MALELDRFKGRACHAESQNRVLELTLEESKCLNDQVSISLNSVLDEKTFSLGRLMDKISAETMYKQNRTDYR